MCGIVGYRGISNAGIAERFASACSLQLHRGSDDSDIHVVQLKRNRELRLGHQRLAIIYLSMGGHQPMYTAEKQAGLVELLLSLPIEKTPRRGWTNYIFRKRKQKLLSTYDACCEQPPDRGSNWFRDIVAPLTLEVWLRHYGDYIDA